MTIDAEDDSGADQANIFGPAKLVLVLLDASLTAIAKAAHAIDESGPAAVALAHQELTRAQDIVLELQLALDHETGGSTARCLDALYSYCLERLVAANVGKDATPLASVSHVLRELRASWEQAVASLRASA